MGPRQDSSQATAGSEKGHIVNVREAGQADFPEIRAMHAAMGLDYKMPDLDSALVPVKVVCEEDGRIIAAGILKIEAETFLWVSPHASPTEKWDAVRLMQAAVMKQAFRIGLEQLVAYVPECVEKFFKRRMLRLGWQRQRDGWRAWSLEVHR